MFALLVVANPNPNSFSHAMAKAAETIIRRQAYDISVHDLYAEQFDPIQPTGENDNTKSADLLVETHCAEISRADLILIFHPNWWGQPPAILKGWIDRVFRLDTAYCYPPGVGYDGTPKGLLRAKCALVFNTSNTPPERESKVFGDPLEALWRNCIFQLCGVENLIRRMYGPITTSTEDQRREWLAEVETLVGDAT